MQRSKRIERNVSHLLAWNSAKEHKLSHLRQQEAARQSAAVVGKPVIASHSSALFHKRDDELAQCKVEDRLHLLGLIYQYQQEERLLEQQKAAGAFHPHVAPHSANLVRAEPVPVHERLYQLSKQRSQRAISHQEEGVHSTLKTKSSSQADEGIPAAIHRLWAIGEAYKKKRRERWEQQNELADRMQVRWFVRRLLLCGCS